MSTSISAYIQRVGDYRSCDDKCLGGATTPAKLHSDRQERVTENVSRRYSLKPSFDSYPTSPSLPRLKRYPIVSYSRYLYLSPRMSNVQNITQRQTKDSVGINTSYRDAYRPWFKSSEKTLDNINGTTSGIRRTNREMSLHPSGSGFVNAAHAKPVSSRYLTGQSNIDRINRVPVSEFSDLSLGEGSPITIKSMITDATAPNSRVATTHVPLPTTSSHSTLLSSAAVIPDQSPPSQKRRSSSPDPGETSSAAGTSNSSNNSSAPRWSSTTTTATTTSSNPSIYTSKTTLLKDQHSYQSGGTMGLNNLGNTCFMNSIIQCLSNTAPLLEYCLSGRYQDELNKCSSMRGTLFASYATLMKELWESDPRDSSVSPHQFKTQIQRFAPRFVGYSQQDAQEFLRYVLEGLHIEVNRVTKRPHPVVPDYASEDRLADREKADIYWKRYLSMDNSEIVDLFVGQLMSTLECTECGFKSTTFDPFWDLSLPIPKKTNVNIMDCLRLFTSKEDLDGNERPLCGRCKTRQRCTKSFSIQKFPRILVLHLKRFSGERFRSKMSLLVDYPITDLNMTEFASSSCPQRSARYNLYAVSNHSGSVYAGHYTATCKHPYTSGWYDFNDSRVRGTNAHSAVSPEGYVLFYEII